MSTRFATTRVFILLLCVLFPCIGLAEQITLKVGTLGPKEAGTGMAVELFSNVGQKLEQNLGFTLKVIGYFGGVMGDDQQMVQKAQLGQLDVLTPTLAGLSTIENRLEVFTMAYVIENFGQYDYIMTKNAKFINNTFWNKGWVSLIILFSEGEHNLYMDKPYRTVEELSANLKASNYTGGPDKTFYDPMNIAQLPVAPTEMYPTFRSGVSNSAILPSLFVIGMQIYAALPNIVYPAVRISSAGIVLTKRKWETLPWDLRTFFAFFQPVMYWMLAGMVRDMSKSFSAAMIQHGCREVRLTPAEFKSWKDRVVAYRETYLGDDKLKRDIYNRMITGINEYNSGNPIERQIFEKDPQYINFPDKIMALLKAEEEFYNTGSKKAILKLTEDKTIERWRVYDALIAIESYSKTGSLKELKKWMNSYYIDEFVEDLFTNHVDSVKKVFGGKEAIRQRIEELIAAGKFFTSRYTGYQKSGIQKQKIGI